MRRVALIAVIILASCGGNGETTRSTQPPPTLTSIPSVTAANSSTSTTTSAAPTTTTTTTTTTLPPDAAAEFAFSQVVFGSLAFVVIINWGNDAGSLAGLWLSQGSSVQALPDVEVGPGKQVLVGLGSEPPPDLTGMVAVLHLGPSVGGIVRSGGELALHNRDDFDNPGSLIDYVAWGDGPQLRLEQAIEAGIWDGATIEIVDEAPSISTGIYPAVRAGDWATDLGG